MKEVKYPGLVAEMARRGEKLKDLEKVLGITNSNISKRMTGKVEWSISEINKLCDYYGKSFDELFKK